MRRTAFEADERYQHAGKQSTPHWYICPQGKVRKLEARRHKSEHNIYRRYEADAAECGGCRRREQCLPHADTQRTHLAVLVAKAKATLSQQMIAKIDTTEARKIYSLRLVEPVFGHIRSQKRLDRFTLRGKITVNSPWMLSCMVHNLEKSAHYGLAA
jgi:hypothetical protein